MKLPSILGPFLAVQNLQDWMTGNSLRAIGHPPELNLTLTPLFDGDANAITGLRVQETLKGLRFDKDESLLQLAAKVTNIDMGYIADPGMAIRDASGELGVVTEKKEVDGAPMTLHIWHPTRATVGDIQITYTALPRPVTTATRSGPSLDFREADGGLIGAGLAFLALPPTDGIEHFFLHVSWDLSECPESTRSAWTFAADSSFTSTESPESLLYAFYAVGSLNALYNPDQDGEEIHDFNMYWFERPPFDPFALGARIATIFQQMQAFFDDRGKSYKVFVRHNIHRGSLTGTAVYRSFMFSWDDTEFDLAPSISYREKLLSHEMVHNWVSLDGPTDEANWYSEGLAEYYCVNLRYRFGRITEAEYITEVNSMLTHYYTSPLVTWPLEEVQKVTWNLSLAQNVPYTRGFTFAMQLNSFISKMTGGTQSIDDPVLNLTSQHQTGYKTDVNDYLALLSAVLGKRLPKILVEDMKSGRLIIPGDNGLWLLPSAAASYRLVREDLERFELGFDERSLLEGPYLVTGLMEGSRAANAGLRNGDYVQMMSSSAYNRAKAEYTSKILLSVRRGKHDFMIEFWPRSYEKVEAYHYETIAREDL